jgi:glycosyltransferase involved in cell wall biosynthesis
MRVLQVVALISPDGCYGGPARVALNQSAELLKRGHEVTLAAATRGFRVPPTEVDGVPVRLFDVRTILPKSGFPGLGSPGLVRWFHVHGPSFDVVHIHFGRDLVVLPVAASARWHKIPYVLQTHGMVVPSRHPLARPLDAVWTRRLLRDAGAVLYLTDQERVQLGNVARASLDLVQLGNGVPNYPPAAFGTEPVEVLFVARMHARKRPLMFVEMAKALLDEGIDAQFTLIGPDEGEGAALTAATEGEPRISWEGALAPADVPRRMAAATIYVLPSEREPFPMTVLEAMAIGLPVVVAADCGLAPLVRSAHCGVVVDGEATAFADAVRSLLADRPRRVEMGELARKTAHNEFGMAAIGDRLTGVYDDVGHRR